MAEFSLPQNSKVQKGKSTPSPKALFGQRRLISTVGRLMTAKTHGWIVIPSIWMTWADGAGCADQNQR